MWKLTKGKERQKSEQKGANREGEKRRSNGIGMFDGKKELGKKHALHVEKPAKARNKKACLQGGGGGATEKKRGCPQPSRTRITWRGYLSATSSGKERQAADHKESQGKGKQTSYLQEKVLIKEENAPSPKTG